MTPDERRLVRVRENKRHHQAQALRYAQEESLLLTQIENERERRERSNNRGSDDSGRFGTPGN